MLSAKLAGWFLAIPLTSCFVYRELRVVDGERRVVLAQLQRRLHVEWRLDVQQWRADDRDVRAESV